MDSKHQDHLALFKRLSGKSECVLAAPVLVEPKMQYWPSKVGEMWK
jgi:hypothetical protein